MRRVSKHSIKTENVIREMYVKITDKCWTKIMLISDKTV